MWGFDGLASSVRLSLWCQILTDILDRTGDCEIQTGLWHCFRRSVRDPGHLATCAVRWKPRRFALGWGGSWSHCQEMGTTVLYGHILW